MNVIVDTCVRSLALRRDRPSRSAVVSELASLVSDGRVQMLGPIRQEILCGVRSESQFESLQQHLAAFPDLPLTTDDYVPAARFFNRCRGRGIRGFNTDFLICAAAARNELAIFTTARDFVRFARHLPIRLHMR